MPLPGDQHRDNAATVNPFADHRAHIAEFTAQEIATLQSRLDKQLGPEYISTRPGAGGGKVHYLAAEKVINLANEVFGFNGWSSSIQNVQIDFVDESPSNQKVTLGLSTIVRVTLRDGTFHEDIGYGHIENCKGKAAAFEKAKKEAATDAMKRALRNFGNVLGNCLYDKDYLSRVTKVKVAPSKWDAENLHRHHDYAPVKKESIAEAEAAQEKSAQKAAAVKRQSSAQSGVSFGSADFEDEFGASGFDDVDFGHPDEVRVEDSTIAGPETPAQRAINGPQQNGGQRQGVPRTHSMPQLRPPNVQPPQQVQGLPAPQRPQGVQRPPYNPTNGGPRQIQQVQPGAQNRVPPPQQINGVHQQRQQPNGMQQPPHHVPQRQPPNAHAPYQQQQIQQQTNASGTGTHSDPSSGATVADSAINGTVPNVDGQQMDQHGMPIPRLPPADAPAGFVTGRSVDFLSKPPETRPPNSTLAFDPNKESPSIRRTVGVHGGKSAPITRSALQGTNGGQQGASGGQATGTPGNGMNGQTTPVRTNFVNPAADMHRRIGAPGQNGGLQNRGAYKPPTAVTGAKRPPLNDVSNLQQMDGVGEAKKAKVEPAVPTTDAEKTAISGDGGEQNGHGTAAA